jgi:hypothetical protein
MPTQIGARLVFENAKKFAAEQGYNVSQAVCTQSYVRSEVAMSTTQANYRIPVLANDTSATTFNTEKRLDLQDVMVVNEIGIFIAAPSSATDATYLLYSNANAGVFTTSAGAASTLWNSFFNVSVNNQVVIPNWDVYRHYFVPFAQNGVGVTAQTIFPRDSQDGSQSGFYPTEPNFILNGAANIQAFITLPAAMATVVANSRIVVIWRGIKLQNVTSVR